MGTPRKYFTEEERAQAKRDYQKWYHNKHRERLLETKNKNVRRYAKRKAGIPVEDVKPGRPFELINPDTGEFYKDSLERHHWRYDNEEAFAERRKRYSKAYYQRNKEKISQQMKEKRAKAKQQRSKDNG